MADESATIQTVRQRLRTQMPVVNKWVYLDHAAMCPLPSPVAETLRQWIDEAVAEGTPIWPDWVRRVEAMRAGAARLGSEEGEENTEQRADLTYPEDEHPAGDSPLERAHVCGHIRSQRADFRLQLGA